MGGAAVFSEPFGERPASDRLGHRVPGTRELEQLLYAGRQRAEAFFSPEKNTLTFSVDYRGTATVLLRCTVLSPSPNFSEIFIY